MRILCLDPGTTNFGLSSITVINGKIHIEGTKRVNHRVKDMKNPEPQYRAFKKELKELGDYDLVVAERFQARGNKGPTIEAISFMLAALVELYPGKTVFLTASTWKNRVNRAFDLKSFYENLKDEQRAVRPVSARKTVHELDSVLLGLYAWYRKHDVPYYRSFVSKFNRDRFLSMFLDSKNL